MGGSERAGTRGGETRATRIKSRFDDVFTFVLYNSRRRCDAAERGGWRGSVRDGTGRVGRETFEGMCSGATLRDPRWRRVFGVRRHGCSSSFARGCLRGRRVAARSRLSRDGPAHHLARGDAHLHRADRLTHERHVFLHVGGVIRQPHLTGSLLLVLPVRQAAASLEILHRLLPREAVVAFTSEVLDRGEQESEHRGVDERARGVRASRAERSAVARRRSWKKSARRRAVTLTSVITTREGCRKFHRACIPYGHSVRP